MKKPLLFIILSLIAPVMAIEQSKGTELVKKPARSYLLSPNSPTTPITIDSNRNIRPVGQVLKDPILSREIAPSTIQQPAKAEKPTIGKLRKKSLKIPKIKISGELTVPTAPFTPQRIEQPYLRERPEFRPPTQVLDAL